MVSTANNIFGTISRLRQCRDFQREPIRAVVGRIRWKLRWLFTQTPCRLRVGEDIDLLVPKTGSGGFIYAYGYSEPETIRFVLSFLQPGMTFWDVGAHVGEYSLLASRKVGFAGRVEAFEPQAAIFHFLEHNQAANRASNVRLHPIAVSDRSGQVEIALHSDPARTFINPGAPLASLPTTQVTAASLDEFAVAQHQVPNLIKVDVEGAERLVLEGARTLLGLPPGESPAWLIEYDPQNCAKFG